MPTTHIHTHTQFIWPFLECNSIIITLTEQVLYTYIPLYHTSLVPAKNPQWESTYARCITYQALIKVGVQPRSIQFYFAVFNFLPEVVVFALCGDDKSTALCHFTFIFMEKTVHGNFTWKRHWPRFSKFDYQTTKLQYLNTVTEI